MKFIFNTIYYLFIVIIILIAGLLLSSLIPMPGNFKVKVVKSGSMEPFIKTGGIVVIAPSSDYKVGDVITFGKDTKTQIPTTHRIVQIDGTGDNRIFTTKGDANDAPDPTTTRFSDIEGKLLFTVPYLGYILDFAKRPIGFALLVGVPALIIIFDEIGKIIKEIKNIRRKKKALDATEENQQQNKVV